MIASTPYQAMFDDYVAAIKWMEGLGIRLQSGRTQHYEKVLGYWKDAHLTASSEEGRAIFPDFVSSMSEIHEFVNIHQGLANVDPTELSSIADKLRKGVNGPINSVDETSGTTVARNFLFEVSVAARAHRPQSGVEAILNSRSDTGIRMGGKKLWVECKRVTSESKLEQNLSKACDQLSHVLDTEVGSGHRGIVAMDVSKLLNRGDMIYVAAGDESLVSSVQRMLDNFIEKNASLWGRVYARKHRKIVGTLFRIAFMATSEARNMLVYSTQWGLSPAPHISSADFAVLKTLATTLDAPSLVWLRSLGSPNFGHT